MSREQRAGAIARQAAAVIEVRGWNQGNFQADDGEVCVRGAFNSAWRQTSAGPPCFAEVEFSLWLKDLGVLDRSPTGYYANYLADWNDEPGRTKEEVVGYLRKFAEERDPQPVLP